MVTRIGDGAIVEPQTQRKHPPECGVSTRRRVESRIREGMWLLRRNRDSQSVRHVSHKPDVASAQIYDEWLKTQRNPAEEVVWGQKLLGFTPESLQTNYSSPY